MNCTFEGKSIVFYFFNFILQECPVGTYKNVDGSDSHLCTPCSVDLLPRRAEFIYVRGTLRSVIIYFFYFLSLSLVPFEYVRLGIYLTKRCTLAAGGVTLPSCPYKCISDKYRMPKCYTPLEELLYTFGGPWPFAILLSCILVLLGLLLSTLRIKLVGSCSHDRVGSVEDHNNHHFPSLLSLSEVPCIQKITLQLRFDLLNL